MKSLYESILDMEDKLDDTSLKTLWKNFKLDIIGSGKNLRCKDKIYLAVNDKDEIVPFNWAMIEKKIDPNDVPSISTVFPDGVTLEFCGIYNSSNRTILGGTPFGSHKLSDLPDNIKIKHYYLSEDNIKILDRPVAEADASCLERDLITDQTFDYVSKYTDKLYVQTLGTYQKGHQNLKLIKNCPFKTLIWIGGAMAFGLDTPIKNTLTINKYLETDKLTSNGRLNPIPDNTYSWRDSLASGQGSKFANEVKAWLKANPNTTLIMTWSSKSKTFEKIELDGDKLVTTKMTLKDIDKL